MLSFSRSAGRVAAALEIGCSGLSSKAGWDELYSTSFDRLRSLVGSAGLLWVGLLLSSLVAGLWLTSVGGADFGKPGALFS